MTSNVLVYYKPDSNCELSEKGIDILKEFGLLNWINNNLNWLSDEVQKIIDKECSGDLTCRESILMQLLSHCYGGHLISRGLKEIKDLVYKQYGERVSNKDWFTRRLLMHSHISNLLGYYDVL